MYSDLGSCKVVINGQFGFVTAQGANYMLLERILCQSINMENVQICNFANYSHFSNLIKRLMRQSINRFTSAM